MGNILNEDIINTAKVNYILFKESKQRVFFNIIELKKVTQDGNYYMGESEKGYINYETSRKITKTIMEDFNQKVYNTGDLNLSTITRYSTSNNYEVEIQYGFKLELSKSDLSIPCLYTRHINSRALKFTDKETDEHYTNNIEVADNNLKFSLDNIEKAYIVVIYPNNKLLPMVRVYTNTEYADIDLFNIDDNTCTFNSYYSKINVEKKETKNVTENKLENLNFIKFDNDTDISKARSVLSQEVQETQSNDANFYYNEAINLCILEGSNESFIKLGDIVLSNIREKCIENNVTNMIDFKEEDSYPAYILNTAEEVYELNFDSIKIHTVYTSGNYNYFKIELADKEYIEFELYKAEVGFMKYVMDDTAKITFLNFIEGDIISELLISNTTNHYIYGTLANDIKGLSYIYSVMNKDIDLSMSITKLVNRIYNDNKETLLISGVSNTDQVAIFARGLLGEIIR